ncbi:MAG: hypothetical protein IT381_11020 [Deltaproteobacteria bacterium]|nr:hypothetical protein [Deltaproteobacteria bacterium]
MVKVTTPESSTTKPQDATPVRTPIRALYGVFINDDLRQFRSDLSQTVEVLETALEDGDRDIQGAKDKRLAEGAIKALKQAIEELRIGSPKKSGSVAAMASAASAKEPEPINVVRPLYGVFIQTQVDKAKTQITSEIAEIKEAVKQKKIPKGEGDDVQRALKDLQTALKKLEKIQTN